MRIIKRFLIGVLAAATTVIVLGGCQKQTPISQLASNNTAATQKNGQWVSQTSHFRGTLLTAVSIPDTDPGQVLTYSSVEDPLSEYDASSGKFTPQTSGLYQVTVTMTVAPAYNSNGATNAWTTGDYCKLFLGSTHSGQNWLSIVSMPAPIGTSSCSVTLTATVPIAQGDSIFVMGVATGKATTGNLSTSSTTFNPYNHIEIVRIAD